MSKAPIIASTLAAAAEGPAISRPALTVASVAGIVGNRRQMLIGGALLAAGAVTAARRPRTPSSFLGTAKLDNLVPHQLGEWNYATSSGLVVPPSDELRDKIYSQLLTRVYTHGNATAMLLIAYSGAQDGVIQVHRPEVCYPASGYQLLENDAYALPLSNNLSIPSRFIFARSERRDEQLAYWTRIGDKFPTRWIEQRVAVAQENLAGIIPDGVLVRISVPSDGAARPIIEAFTRALYQGVSPRMRQVLVGSEG